MSAPTDLSSLLELLRPSGWQRTDPVLPTPSLYRHVAPPPGTSPDDRRTQWIDVRADGMARVWGCGLPFDDDGVMPVALVPAYLRSKGVL